MLEKYFLEISVSLIFLISLMSTVVFFLLKNLKEQKKNQDEEEQKCVEKEKFILESLDIICRALIQGQCDLSEGCIRIRMLMTKSKMLADSNESRQVVFSMYEELKDLKTHEKRKELSNQERINEDKLRLNVEEKYREEFLVKVNEFSSEVKGLL